MMIFHIEIVIMSIIKSKKVRSYKEKCLSADNKCQLLSTAESIFFIPVFFFFFQSFCLVALFCAIIILALRKWLFTSCFKVSVGFEASPRRPFKGVKAQPCYLISIYSQAARPQSQGRLPVWRWTGCGLSVSIQWPERGWRKLQAAAQLWLLSLSTGLPLLRTHVLHSACIKICPVENRMSFHQTHLCLYFTARIFTQRLLCIVIHSQVIHSVFGFPG